MNVYNNFHLLATEDNTAQDAHVPSHEGDEVRELAWTPAVTAEDINERLDLPENTQTPLRRSNRKKRSPDFISSSMEKNVRKKSKRNLENREKTALERVNITIEDRGEENHIRIVGSDSDKTVDSARTDIRNYMKRRAEEPTEDPDTETPPNETPSQDERELEGQNGNREEIRKKRKTHQENAKINKINITRKYRNRIEKISKKPENKKEINPETLTPKRPKKRSLDMAEFYTMESFIEINAEASKSVEERREEAKDIAKKRKLMEEERRGNSIREMLDHNETNADFIAKKKEITKNIENRAERQEGKSRMYSMYDPTPRM